ncbi:hypothetical protein ACB092_10G046300 [Castanea dentata]
MLGGRLKRGHNGYGELEIIAVTLSEFLEQKEKEEAKAQLVFWNDIDEHDPQFSPLFYVQVTNFQRGGHSIGISCSILLADLWVKENFLNNWASIHNNILSSNKERPKKPIFYLPDFNRNCSSPTIILSSTPRKDCGQIMHFKVTAGTTNLEGEVCKSLALLCIEETESRLGREMASSFYLFSNENSEVIKDRKNQVTCAGWDEYIGANEVAFRDGNKPMHVYYWIGSIFDGLVIAIPPLINHATLGVNILVTVPNMNKQ